MALFSADRVLESSTSTGTGTFNLDGAQAGGYQGFVAGVGSGNTCHYCIANPTADEWEVGIGTVTDVTPDTLSRDTVLASSNADALVNFSSGTKDVFCVISAGNTIRFANGVGLISDAGGELRTGSGGKTWQFYPGGNDAAAFVCNDDTAIPVVSMVVGDGADNWGTFFYGSDYTTKLLDIDHTGNQITFTASAGVSMLAEMDMADHDITFDNGYGLWSDAGGVLTTGPGGKTWQARAADNQAASFVCLDSSGNAYVVLSIGDGAGSWATKFLKSDLTNDLLLIDHSADEVTIGGPLASEKINPVIAINALATSAEARLAFKDAGATVARVLYEIAANQLLVEHHASGFVQSGFKLKQDGTIEIITGGTLAGNGTPHWTFNTDGSLSSALSNYETLVTADDDIPNKKYVDDAIAAASGGWSYTSTAVNKSLADREHVTVTASGKTMTLPASPSGGEQIRISVGAFTDTVIGRNGKTIKGQSDDAVINVEQATVELIYIASTGNWVVTG